MNKKELVAKYEEMRAEDYPMQECMSCGQMMPRSNMDRHHPAGRFKINILRYVYLCRECHSVVHDDPKGATARGLLWPRRNTHCIGAAEWIQLLATMREHQYEL